eukprot:NODE_21_length_42443_cov_0.822808.p2 type:complete len:856 gc:universal NODE_21_length_42443_cov_0.822808:36556-33989(-)
MFSKKKVLFVDFPNQSEITQLWTDYEKSRSELDLKKSVDFFLRHHPRNLQILKFENVPDKLLESIKDVEILARYGKIELENIIKEERLNESLAKALYFTIDPNLHIRKILTKCCSENLIIPIKKAANVSVGFLMKHIQFDFPRKYTLLACIASFSCSADLLSEQTEAFKKLDLSKFDLEEICLYWYGWIVLVSRHLVSKNETLVMVERIVQGIVKCLQSSPDSYIVLKNCKIQPKIYFFNEWTNKGICIFSNLTAKLDYSERIISNIIEANISGASDVLKFMWMTIIQLTFMRSITPTFLIQGNCDTILVKLSTDNSTRDKIVDNLLLGDFTVQAANTPSSITDMNYFFVLFVSKFLKSYASLNVAYSIDYCTLLLRSHEALRPNLQSCLLAQEWDKFIFKNLETSANLNNCLDNLYWIFIDNYKVCGEILSDLKIVEIMLQHVSHNDFEPILKEFISIISRTTFYLYDSRFDKLLMNVSDVHSKIENVEHFFAKLKGVCINGSIETNKMVIGTITDVLSLCEDYTSKNTLQNICIKLEMFQIFSDKITTTIDKSMVTRFLLFLKEILHNCQPYTSNQVAKDETQLIESMKKLKLMAEDVPLLLELLMSELSTQSKSKTNIALVLLQDMISHSNQSSINLALSKISNHLKDPKNQLVCSNETVITHLLLLFKYIQMPEALQSWVLICETLCFIRFNASIFKRLQSCLQWATDTKKLDAYLQLNIKLASITKSSSEICLFTKSANIVFPSVAFSENIPLTLMITYKFLKDLQEPICLLDLTHSEFRFSVVHDLKCLKMIISFQKKKILEKVIIQIENATASQTISFTIAKKKNSLSYVFKFPGNKIVKEEVGIGNF